jgi:hypothetical protein
MKRAAISIAVLCLFVGTFAQVAKSQKKIPNVAGNWESITRMPGGHDVTEQWVITQKGDKLTATVKTAGGDKTAEGTIDEVGFFRVDIKDGDMLIKVRATLDENSLDGSTTIGKDEHLWAAKRKK